MSTGQGNWVVLFISLAPFVLKQKDGPVQTTRDNQCCIKHMFNSAFVRFRREATPGTIAISHRHSPPHTHTLPFCVQLPPDFINALIRKWGREFLFANKQISLCIWVAPPPPPPLLRLLEKLEENSQWNKGDMQFDGSQVEPRGIVVDWSKQILFSTGAFNAILNLEKWNTLTGANIAHSSQ